MVKKLKQKIRESVEEKYNAQYQKEWKEKKLSYENWLKEQQTFDKKSYQTLAFEVLKKKISLITWEQLAEVQNLSDLNLKDIAVFGLLLRRVIYSALIFATTNCLKNLIYSTLKPINLILWNFMLFAQILKQVKQFIKNVINVILTTLNG